MLKLSVVVVTDSRLLSSFTLVFCYWDQLKIWLLFSAHTGHFGRETLLVESDYVFLNVKKQKSKRWHFGIFGSFFVQPQAGDLCWARKSLSSLLAESSGRFRFLDWRESSWRPCFVFLGCLGLGILWFREKVETQKNPLKIRVFIL